MFCKKCGKELKEGEKFCTGCGTRVSAVPENATVKITSNEMRANAEAQNVSMPTATVQKVTVEKVQNPEKKSVLPIVLGVIAGIVILIGLLGLVFSPFKATLMSGDEVEQIAKSTVETVIADAETETEVENKEENIAEEMDELSMKISEVEESITDYSDREQVKEAVRQCTQLVSEYEVVEASETKASELFDTYKNLLTTQISAWKTEEPRAALYTQMKDELSTAMQYAQEFKKCGIAVNSTEIESLKVSLKDEYKQMMVNNFDAVATNAIATNGVVSRSELWSKVEGLKDTDLYDTENPEDELRRRYAAAFTLHYESELEKMISAGEDVDTIYDKIKEAMPEADYHLWLSWYISNQLMPDNYDWMWREEMDALYNTDTNTRRNNVYYYCVEDEYEYLREMLRNILSENLR